MKSSEKFSEELRTRVTYETRLELMRMAHESGMNEAEYVRTVFMIHIFGKDEVINRQLERLEMIANRGEK